MTGAELLTDIVDAVAAVDDVEVSEIESLHEYIDPEVLSKLDAQDRGEWTFTFQFADHQITVNDDSEILVDGAPYSPDVSIR